MRFVVLVMCLACSGASPGAGAELDAIEGVFLDRFVSLWQAGDAAGLADGFGRTDDRLKSTPLGTRPQRIDAITDID